MPVSRGLHFFAYHPEILARPPILLIHGAGGNHLYWPPQIRRLPGQRIFALDLPGHGKSPGTGRQSIDAYATDVAEFLPSIGLSKAVLVGHSMGGAIAMYMARRNPDRVLGLGLVATGAKLRVNPEILSGVGDADSFLAAISLILGMSFAVGGSPRLKQLAASRMSEMRPSVLHGDFLACDTFDARAWLSQITVPTLIICGAQDRMTPPRHSEFLEAGIRGAQLVIVPDAGHMVMLEQPERVAQHIERFLSGIDYRPGA